jgi:hypothetical protein
MLLRPMLEWEAMEEEEEGEEIGMSSAFSTRLRSNTILKDLPYL